MNLRRVFLNRTLRLFIMVLIVFILIYFLVNLGACETRERVIKIGNQAVLSGKYRSFGEDQMVSIKLASSKLSPVRIGGFDYEIEVVTKDDEGNPEKAFLAAQEMVNEEVACAIGSTFSGTTEVSVPVYEEYGIPVISPSAQKTEISKMGNTFFRIVMNNKQKIENIADFIKNEIKPQKLMLISNKEEDSIKLVDYLREVLSNYGIETPKPMSIKISEEDVTVIAENLLIEGPHTFSS